MLPFLPFGWLFLALAALLVVPYFDFMKKFISWLGEKDSTGLVGKAGKKAAQLYRWADDHEKAETMEKIADENGANEEAADDKKD